jgi:hypothetical protein
MNLHGKSTAPCNSSKISNLCFDGEERGRDFQIFDPKVCFFEEVSEEGQMGPKLLDRQGIRVLRELDGDPQRQLAFPAFLGIRMLHKLGL